MMPEEFELFLLQQDWWISSKDGMQYVGCMIADFGKIEIPNSQLIKLEDKHNQKATRKVGG